MANPLRDFQRRVANLESRGYQVPSYLHKVTNPETAKRWNVGKIIEKSKAIDPRTGRETSGRRLQEMERSEAGKKAYKTKLSREEKRRLTWDKEKRKLQGVVNATLDTFRSDRLRNKIKSLFSDVKDDDDFWRYFFTVKDEALMELQAHAFIPYKDEDAQKEAYDYWVSFLNYGEVPENEFRELIGQINDEEGNEDIEDEYRYDEELQEYNEVLEAYREAQQDEEEYENVELDMDVDYGDYLSQMFENGYKPIFDEITEEDDEDEEDFPF